MDKLTPLQIENWRNILLTMVGPYALLMTDEQVQAYRDKMQERADSLTVPTTEAREGGE